MAQQVRRRKQGTVEYSANNKQTESLSRGVVYRELALRLTGKLDCDAAHNTGDHVQAGDEWGVIKKIAIVANGTDVIKSISGHALWMLNYFLYSRPRLTLGLIDTGTADPAFDSVLVLPFWMPSAVKPMDTALDSRELSSLEIEITWGDEEDINENATANFITDPKVEVYSLESFNVSGPFSQWRIFPIEKEITSTTSEFEIELPVGKMYRGFMIQTTDAGVDQGDILNNLKLVSGSTVFADVSCADDVLHQWEAIRKGLNPSFDLAGAAYDDIMLSDASDFAGWYFYDHVTDGFLTESVDTLGFSEFKLSCDVTKGGGTTKINVWPMQIIPIRSNRNGS